MRKPKGVIILGKHFTIEHLNHLETPDGSEIWADIDVDAFHIRVVNSRNWRSHLWHEILHGILKLSGRGETLTVAEEESLVVLLENATSGLVELKLKGRNFIR